jgi:hypothetical protein
MFYEDGGVRLYILGLLAARGGATTMVQKWLEATA